jgi:DnaJ-class molecular chaperone
MKFVANQMAYEKLRDGSYSPDQDDDDDEDEDSSDDSSTHYSPGFNPGFDGHWRGDDTSRQYYNPPVNGAHARIDLDISLEDCIFGAEKTVKVKVEQTCRTCSGSCEGTYTKTCTSCSGRGFRYGGRYGRKEFTCSSCLGDGQRTYSGCRTCKDSGRTERQRVVDFRIPKLTPDGIEITVPGGGADGLRGGKTGDLKVKVHIVVNEPMFESGFDIWSAIEIDYFQAWFGCVLHHKHLRQTLEVVVQPRTAQGGDICFSGLGLPKDLKGRRGDLHLSVSVKAPDKFPNLAADDLELVRAIIEKRPRPKPPEKPVEKPEPVARKETAQKKEDAPKKPAEPETTTKPDADRFSESSPPPEVTALNLDALKAKLIGVLSSGCMDPEATLADAVKATGQTLLCIDSTVQVVLARGGYASHKRAVDDALSAWWRFLSLIWNSGVKTSNSAPGAVSAFEMMQGLLRVPKATDDAGLTRHKTVLLLRAVSDQVSELNRSLRRLQQQR